MAADDSEHLAMKIGLVSGTGRSRNFETCRITGESEQDRLRGSGGPVFHREPDRGDLDRCRSIGAKVLGFFKVQVGVAPGVQIGGSPEGLPTGGSIALARMVDEEDGQVEAPLEGAEIGEEPGDVCSLVLI
jgi:hypothetical protein